MRDISILPGFFPYQNNFIIFLLMGVKEVMGFSDDAISEVIAEILIIFLVLTLGAIVGAMLFGVMPSIPKTAYLATEGSYKTMPTYSAIAIHHRAGDTLSFSPTPLSSYPSEIYVDTKAGSFLAVPDRSAALFQPGDTIYVYNTATGYHITKDLTGVTAVPLPSGTTSIKIIDSNANLLIVTWPPTNNEISPTSTVTVTPTATATATATINVTATTTATTTPTNTTTPPPTATATTTATSTDTTTPAPTATATPTNTPTPTATTTTTVTATVTATPTTTKTLTPTGTESSDTRTITVIWSPKASGYCSESPPVRLTNSQEIRVPRGSSKTLYFVPNSDKVVLTIKLDGTTVYSGSSVGSTISYTVSNIVEDRTLTATFS